MQALRLESLAFRALVRPDTCHTEPHTKKKAAAGRCGRNFGLRARRQSFAQASIER
jgi:hypothetical protein